MYIQAMKDGSNFQFATAAQIIFGAKSVGKVKNILPRQVKKIVLVTGKNQERAKILASTLSSSVEVKNFTISTEPTIDSINEGVNFSRNFSAETVIGFGGGSVIDAAKAIAAMVTNPGELMDYLEVIGKGKPLENRPLPCIAIPTTAGTGAEVTKNAVIKSVEKKVKVSLRHEWMYPGFAVIDPELTVSMTPELTAVTGMDALSHLLESFVSNQPNSMVDMVCREGLTRIGRSLKKAFLNGADLSAREDMAMASMLGGMALANGKLGAVHGFAGPMGGIFAVPHGVVCARLMPAVMEINFQNMSGNRKNTERFNEVARLLTGNKKAKAADGIEWVEKQVEEMRIPELSVFGITAPYFAKLVEKAKNASSMKGNPVLLSDPELLQILSKSVKE